MAGYKVDTIRNGEWANLHGVVFETCKEASNYALERVKPECYRIVPTDATITHSYDTATGRITPFKQPQPGPTDWQGYINGIP